MRGAPIRRGEGRVEETAEDGLEFGLQMGREAAGVGETAGARREQLAETAHGSLDSDRRRVLVELLFDEIRITDAGVVSSVRRNNQRSAG